MAINKIFKHSTIITFTILVSASGCSKDGIPNEELPPLPNFTLVDGDNAGYGYTGKKPSTFFYLRYRVTEKSDVNVVNVTSSFPTYWDNSYAYNDNQHEWLKKGFSRGLFVNRSLLMEAKKDHWEFSAQRGDTEDSLFANDPDYVNVKNDPVFNPPGDLAHFIHKNSITNAREIAEYGKLFLRPIFKSSSEGTEEYKCKVDQRIKEYQGPGNIIDTYNILWDKTKPTGITDEFRLFINHDNGTWSRSRTGSDERLPADLDNNGSIWDPIKAGSEKFACFNPYDIPGIFHQRIECTHGLDIKTGEFKKISIPSWIDAFTYENNVKYRISRPMGVYDGNIRYEWVPGSLDVSIGACIADGGID